MTALASINAGMDTTSPLGWTYPIQSLCAAIAGSLAMVILSPATNKPGQLAQCVVPAFDRDRGYAQAQSLIHHAAWQAACPRIGGRPLPVCAPHREIEQMADRDHSERWCFPDTSAGPPESCAWPWPRHQRGESASLRRRARVPEHEPQDVAIARERHALPIPAIASQQRLRSAGWDVPTATNQAVRACATPLREHRGPVRLCES